MGQALYRRYRSKNLAEIIGQEHITRTLENAVSKGAISHAYLMTGPRGVGKTSIARILAHQINELPYEGEKTHLDIIEIDAASNRRIDEIRDLRDKVHNAPTSAKYKVYIIDEVHMLTREAFNALLKTLEEPPAHVVFILATTDVHKLPDTIISRTQHFSFKPIDEINVAQHLAAIAKQEDIKIDQKALELLARHGEGSFRDSISLLEQAAAINDDIGLGDVQMMLGVPSDESIDQLLAALLDNNAKAIVSTIEELSVRGYQSEQIASQLSRKLRTLLIEGQASEPEVVSRIIKELLEVPVSRDPKGMLEIGLLSNISHAPRPLQTKKSIEKPNISVRPKDERHKTEPVTEEPYAFEDMKSIPNEPEEDKDSESAKEKQGAKADSNKTPDIQGSGDAMLDEQAWEKALLQLKKTHSTLYSVARMADFSCNTETVTLSFQFPFHQKRIETAKNKQLLTDCIAQVCGQEIAIKCVVKDKKQIARKPKPTPEAYSDSSLETISNIFGGGEMLES